MFTKKSEKEQEMFSTFIYCLYMSDVLDEEVILKWYNLKARWDAVDPEQRSLRGKVSFLILCGKHHVLADLW